MTVDSGSKMSPKSADALGAGQSMDCSRERKSAIYRETAQSNGVWHRDPSLRMTMLQLADI